MVFAADRVNGGGNHFATTAEESQYIDEFLVLPAQPRTNNLGILAVFSKQFDGLAKRNRLIGGDSGALLCLRQARAGVASRPASKTNAVRRETGIRWGVNGAPVNAA